jgi:ferredoxin-thioredoxin reductase catalytic chain
MEIQKLYEMLEDTQGKKGYFFNRDKQRVFELLESLLVNRDRYGYMSCPCRLATGKRDRDRDIICPCIYREADIEEYGSCYCNLYVSEDWNKENIPHGFVLERRPPEKLDFRGEKT